ncbi:MaoC family dehydratase [Actinomycetospora termitidis]|uniref:MaoC/PaaZ C-terminal domain-containing protein n=1 Tax=Actinomycetospora termitidis TaxID=3053470 RepID=A0ABT7MAN8_9PSEU|nr:MaoC/PaaZ C-terminal domain-containing protein [Actinomycetospora sp. Odt1-22]MDL5157729.1 MaoC/PaaZ C-terminal domain-containing protein [Actinomycetospora sp. Odt1-22]
MPTETLDSAPTLGALYGRALLTARSGGDTLPDRTLELVNATIDADAVADYAHVCGFRVGGELPITYPHMLAFPLQMRLMTDREFPLPAPGMVHLRNVITREQPLTVGEPLVVRVHAERLVAHPKGAQVDLVSTVGTPDTEVAWHSRSTYFVRGATADEATDAAPPEPEPHVGDRPHAVWKVPGDIGRRYAAVSGDVNPIHVNGLAARAFGMPGTIAHGMWSKARVLAALAGRIDEAVTVDAVFRSPLRTPSTAFLYTAAAKDGWDAALRSAKGKDHLLLTVRPA